MYTIRIATSAASTVTEVTLKAGPSRLLSFLQGVADPVIHVQLAPFGWSEQRQEEAWSLLSELGGARVVQAAPAADPVGEAFASCETWQATGLVRARAMLELTHPEQAAFLFNDFEAANGMKAVLNVATFLERQQALASGAQRKGSRKADHEALLLIEESGTTKETLKELHAMVEMAQNVAAPAPVPQELVGAGARRVEVLRKIYAWISAWSEIARTVITRRDQLIQLGIARRRARKAKGVVAPPPAALPAAPAAPQLVRAVALAPRVPTSSLADDDHAPESRAA